MARPTDATRILTFLSNTLGGKASIPTIASALGWTKDQTEWKVARAVHAGILFYSATTGMVTRKRKSASPDKGKVKSRRATKQAKPSQGPKTPEQLELPLTTPEIDVNFDMQVATLG